MPPDTTTITATAILMGLGAAPITGCFSANTGEDDVQTSTDISGADYGGPDCCDEVFDTESSTSQADTSTSSSSSTSETTDTGTTDSGTTTDTTTGTGGMCGWDPGNSYYECGFEGVDPGGIHPIECPDGLVEGDPCATTGLSGEGCCDANGDNWYCAQGDVVFFMVCG